MLLSDDWLVELALDRELWLVEEVPDSLDSLDWLVLLALLSDDRLVEEILDLLD